MSHSWCTDDDEDDIISPGRVSNSANTRRRGTNREEGRSRKEANFHYEEPSRSRSNHEEKAVLGMENGKFYSY